MYIIFPIVLLVMIICSFCYHFRKKRIIKKICAMSVPEKLCRLNELARPFGFQYLLSQDVFTSCPDAWQRDYGYCRLYDISASRFNMVFDCEPIYFDYEGCTWLIEFWKGQYGINTGAEIGIYKADSLVPESHRDTTLFHTVPDQELPVFEITLLKGACPLFYVARRHWWLTGFRMGEYTEPELLTLKISITFCSSGMQNAFCEGLQDAGYFCENIRTCGLETSFTFDMPCSPQPRHLRRFRAAFASWQNQWFLKLYCHVTRPFTFTVDKLLYLYGYLPFAFCHMVCISRKRSKRRR